MTLDLVLKNAQLALPGGGLTPGSVGVKDGRIAVIAEKGEELTGRETVDCGGLWLMPGVVDPHVHFDLAIPKPISRRNRARRRWAAPPRSCPSTARRNCGIPFPS